MVACSYVKREAEVTKWDDKLSEQMHEMKESFEEDEMTNEGKMKVDHGIVWCEASSIAIRGRQKCSLGKKTVFNHVN